MPTSRHLWSAVALLVLLLHVVVSRHITKAKRKRTTRIHPDKERVIILGASSGVGRALTKHYAARGARVCPVARREELLQELVKECGSQCTPFTGDFTSPADMERLRRKILQEWDGLDTLHICAGVSAVQPAMALAGYQTGEDGPDVAGVKRAVEIAGQATQGNVVGPLVAATTFIPMMKRTSASPAILLVSSVAAVIPAPTRALYAATKAAALKFFQSLAIEHPEISFTCMLPATIQGNFRSSAVDVDPSMRTGPANKKGLAVEYVAGKCADAVDRGTGGNVVLPWIPYALAHHLYYIWPSLIERAARRKYHFKA
ncbi:short-chain dehydrogenase [Xylaria bambusicola]|uniref:short-chain dehydrogenase n=1 Tax=Xylaria bambusicola TaxID=326684 RepID=UPI0020079DE3|nr:short-chain dehydrogenase [Xylaria bambusicola]KAI0512836.1 short-chain dehydrogenase [Xylaria bambusicola]